MKHYKLPFEICLDKKYTDVNIDHFPIDWKKSKGNRKSRPMMIENNLHIELSKFKTYGISLGEIIDLGMRYALGKHEFRRLAAEVIEHKTTFKTQ